MNNKNENKRIESDRNKKEIGTKKSNRNKKSNKNLKYKFIINNRITN